jgi:hypothetical protein
VRGRACVGHALKAFARNQSLQIIDVIKPNLLSKHPLLECMAVEPDYPKVSIVYDSVYQKFTNVQLRANGSTS